MEFLRGATRAGHGRATLVAPEDLPCASTITGRWGSRSPSAAPRGREPLGPFPLGNQQAAKSLVSFGVNSFLCKPRHQGHDLISHFRISQNRIILLPKL